MSDVIFAIIAAALSSYPLCFICAHFSKVFGSQAATRFLRTGARATATITLSEREVLPPRGSAEFPHNEYTTDYTFTASDGAEIKVREFRVDGNVPAEPGVHQMQLKAGDTFDVVYHPVGSEEDVKKSIQAVAAAESSAAPPSCNRGMALCMVIPFAGGLCMAYFAPREAEQRQTSMIIWGSLMGAAILLTFQRIWHWKKMAEALDKVG
jgi:hypothetical protein